jgi:predicted negative regulator of RcsB-dependent stress response
VEDYLSEKEQWEWVKGQVRENGPAVILAVVLVVGGLAGSRYTQMVQALEKGDRTQTLVLLGQLERESATSPYTDQARLLAARAYVDEGDLDKAARELAVVADHSKDRELAVVARLRLARVQVAQGHADAALETLKGSDAGAFAARYHEVRGDAYFAKGDKVAALNEYHSAQGSSAPGSTPLLDLKIADLAAAAPASATTGAAASPAK